MRMLENKIMTTSQGLELQYLWIPYIYKHLSGWENSIMLATYPKYWTGSTEGKIQ